MKIAIGSDHAGFNYKESIKQYLKEAGYEYRDFGTDSEDSVDYPVFIRPVAEAVAAGEFDRGIILGGSGNGEAMVANRIPGIRCALCWDVETARLARSHNDANMVSLGERMISQETALAIVKTWLETPFDGGRHLKRIQMIDWPDLSAKTSATAGGTAEEAESLGEEGPAKWDILIAFRYIKYMEGKRELEFTVEPGLKEPTVIHVPSPETWEKEMPEWAKNRRDEILGRVKPKCVHLKPEWREY